MSIDNKVAVIILAAGLGKRMKSNKAKVLHEILDKPMIMYVVETAKKVAGKNVIIVIGHQAEKVREIVSEKYETIFVLQERQLGTGHAVFCALPYLPSCIEEVIILCGDVPLLTSDTAIRFFDDHVKEKRDISILAVKIDNPTGYGRILFDEKGHVSGIVEESDANKEQKKIKTINTGTYCIRKKLLIDSIKKIKSKNVQGEIYFTDIIEIGYSKKKNVGALIGTDEKEVIGVNNSQDIDVVETIMKKRLSKIP